MSVSTQLVSDPYFDLQRATRIHRQQHGCGAYTFEDGPGLRELSARVQAKRVLELGTGLGYTACCMAHGSPSALIDTIEGDETHVALALEQIERYGLGERIVVHHGPFDLVLATLTTGYDLIFFDGFAPSPKVIWRLRELLTDKGLLVCSNLQLASGYEARELASELGDVRRWRALADLEGGRTRVLAKLGN